MCRRFTCLASVILILGLAAGAANADLADGLVGYYPLDEGAGTTAMDKSGGGHDGTLNNGVTWISQGAIGGGVNVDGSANTRIELGTWNPAAGTGQISLALWIRWAGGGGTYQGLIGKRDAWPGTTMFQFQVRPENNGTFRIETGTNAIVSPNGTMNPLAGQWAHVAATFDGSTAKLYLNGEEIASGAFALNSAGAGSNMGIGCVTGGGAGYSGNGEVFSGDLDEVYIYNRALSASEIVSLMSGLEEYPYAGNPTPADGSLYTQPWANLSWRAGDNAASHDIYFGDSYDDVLNGTGGAFQKNQTSKYFLLGLAGYPYPGGLVPGTTYYWRIDEVEADGTTKHTGNVWSFTIPPNKAYDPEPADGMGLVALQPILRWSPGYGASMHFVYFADDYDAVANAPQDTGEFVAEASYSPAGPLEAGKTYYWRVDESNPQAQTYFKGDVWSFTTQSDKPGGLLGRYFTHPGGTIPSNPFQTLVLTRIDDQVNFAWGAGSPDAAVPVDDFAARWTGEVTIPISAEWTFYTATDDGQRLWVNDQQLIDDWNNHGTTEVSGTIYLEAGTYPIEMHYFEAVGGAEAYLRWECEFVPKDIIPAIALSPPVKAGSPKPGNGAADVNRETSLEWVAGQYAASHNVFFGTDAQAVADAMTASPEYKGSFALGAEKYDPAALDLGVTYYWRVDEINSLNPDSPWMGNLWSFTVGDFLVVDDFEDYNNFDPDRIFETWIDGWGDSGNGSIAGYPEPDFDAGETFVETTIVHSGDQSMPFFYENNMKYSEVARTLPAHMKDWTQEGVKALSLWYYGYPAGQGSFSEGPAGIYTMTGAGGDIWNIDGVEADEFHFAWKVLQGAGSIEARVSAISGANLQPWAKAGVMIRETLDPNSAHAFMYLTNTQGISFQLRPEAAGTSTNHDPRADEADRPKWLKLERDFSGNLTAYHANDVGGSPDAWTMLNPTIGQMASTAYIGLALTSHQRYVPATATFSNVTTTGNVTGATFTAQDIGISSNASEPMYVTIKDAQGRAATVYNTDPAAANVAAWTAWGEYGQGIALNEFTAQTPGLDIASLDAISIGFGTKGNIQPAGGGLVFFDDIRLYKPKCLPQLAKPASDFNNDCVVSMPDLQILTNNWLKTDWQVTPVAPSTAGLVGYYALEDNVLDGSGMNHHGDPCNAPTYVTGKVGSAMQFNGSNQYVDLGTWNPSEGTGRLTVALWAKWDGLSGYWQGLIAKRDTWDAEDMMWQIEAHADTGALGFFRSGSHPDDGDVVLPIGVWTHVAATFDGTTATFYIDGSATGSGPFSFASDTESPVVFGACQGNGGNPFNGALDEVRLYNRALSQEEVASLAGKTTTFTQDLSMLLRPHDAAIDTNADGAIDFKDYATLIDAWLDEVLWP